MARTRFYSGLALRVAWKDLLEFTSRNELERLDSVVSKHPRFQYKTEFQSHEPEVKDRDVKRANQMDSSQSVSSENALLAEKSFINGQNQYSGSGHSLQWTEKWGMVCPHIMEGIASDYETFLSGDDLRINLWNLEVSNQCFNIIDMKPANMEDLLEVITAAEFHPSHCNLLAYSSSRGFIRIVDMRQSALCDHNARILKDEESHGPKSFFTEIIASITDLKFANDGRHILSRDYMNLKLWDINMDAGPVATFRIHENLRPKVCMLNILRIFSCGSGSEEGVTIEASKTPNRKPHVQTTSRPRRSSLSNLARGFYRQGNDHHSARSNDFSYDFNSKLLHVAWHPTTNLIACAAGNSLLMYYA
ncbi:UNVERIFIED_CONTAM: Serine/threonine protein phosphatase 2A regulatory subunit B alpha isoform [Sesamum angustifolium]|uniref:Serine/threonine protein phosphatase 2A regulatory subunit B alpha isoform n=1 Tax=Sesamum angustifolium TaxID=2727405 RepID=A0AAW2LJ94_9LAMI